MIKNLIAPFARLGKILLWCCLAALISFALQRFCYKRTEGFALYKIFSSLTPNPEWELPSPSDEELSTLQNLFNQPFYYLGKGAQAYVFSSQDGSAVIKLCRFDHLRPPFWFTNCLIPFAYERERIERILHKRGRLEQEFGSYKIAFEEMRQETGLIYLHLNKTSFWNKTITLYDKSKVVHKLNLDQIEFIVQKKATLVYPTLSELMQTQGEDATKAAIAHLVKLLAQRCTKGIFDKDPDLATNFGFLGNMAVQIDIGRFLLKETSPPLAEIREEMWRITHPLHQWLEKEYPSLASYLSEEIATQAI